MKKPLLSLACFLLFAAGANLSAQQFSKAECSLIRPLQLILENYTPVNLSKEIVDDPMANRFDVNNPYTYLQLLNDATANHYHILLQTNFMGKILFLAYSNNLSALFNKKEKPMFQFTRCLKNINNHISPVQVMEAVINCMVERLNYCSDD